MSNKLEKIKQEWLDVDCCDKCGKQIKYGDDIYLDVEHEHAGIIPAYCEECKNECA